MGKSGPNISQNAHDLARKEKVDVGEIKGTGTGGQITVTDVKKHLAAQRQAQTPDTASHKADAVPEEEAKPPAEQEPSGDGSGVDAPAAVTPPTQAAPPADVPPISPTPGVPVDVDSGRKTIQRVNQTTGAWWCPFCGRSMEATLPDCGGCGAVRDGEEAVRSA